MKNQLFRVLPSREFVKNYLQLFIPKGFDTYYQFYRQDVVDKKVAQKMKRSYFKNNFRKYYLPCKYNKYFPTIDEKKAITILRQLLKIYGYNIISREKYERGNKYLVYKLVKTHEPIKIKNGVGTNIVYFD